MAMILALLTWAACVLVDYVTLRCRPLESPSSNPPSIQEAPYDITDD